MQGTYELFESIVEEENLYQNYSRQELKLILRYHSYAIFGILQDWTPEDTKNLDMIVHEVYLIMMGKNATEDVFLCWKMLLFIRDSFVSAFIDLEAVLKVKLTEAETDWE